MRNKVKTISIFTTKWGHESIAYAIRDALPDHYTVYVNVIKVERISDQSYAIFYRFLPGLYKVSLKIGEHEQLVKPFMKYLERAYLSEVQKLLPLQKPDLCINTYFAFNPLLERLVKSHFINVIANPRTFAKIETSRNATNIFFDKKARDNAKMFGVQPKSLAICGWFVKKQFYESYEIRRVRKDLDLDLDVFTVCVVGGSEGMYSIVKILPAFINPAKKVQVVVICGKSKQLSRAIKAFSKLLEFKNENCTTIKTIGFTKQIYLYLQAADLVVGKAGPNLIFETVATQTPFFAIAHISGIEDGNLDIIREYKLGYVEENPLKAIKLLREIIKKPRHLRRFAKPLSDMTKYLKNSNNKLKDLLS